LSPKGGEIVTGKTFEGKVSLREPDSWEEEPLSRKKINPHTSPLPGRGKKKAAGGSG